LGASTVRRLSALVAAASAVWSSSLPFRLQPQQVAVDPPPLRIVTSFPVEFHEPSVQGFWMHEYGVGEMLMQFRSDGQFHPWLAKGRAAGRSAALEDHPPSRGQNSRTASR